MKRLLLTVAFALGAAACGDPRLDGPCNVTCDCKRTDAPVKCPGEWLCNPQKTCEYSCRPGCAGPVSTCPSDSDCNGSICSERKSCG
jgi:hypothetical protein